MDVYVNCKKEVNDSILEDSGKSWNSFSNKFVPDVRYWLSSALIPLDRKISRCDMDQLSRNDTVVYTLLDLASEAFRQLGNSTVGIWSGGRRDGCFHRWTLHTGRGRRVFPPTGPLYTLQCRPWIDPPHSLDFVKMEVTEATRRTTPVAYLEIGQGVDIKRESGWGTEVHQKLGDFCNLDWILCM